MLLVVVSAQVDIPSALVRENDGRSDTDLQKVCQVTVTVNNNLNVISHAQLGSVESQIISFGRKIHREAVVIWWVLLDNWHMESPSTTSCGECR
jgi:hypothetical protein